MLAVRFSGFDLKRTSAPFQNAKLNRYDAMSSALLEAI